MRSTSTGNWSRSRSRGCSERWRNGSARPSATPTRSGFSTPTDAIVLPETDEQGAALAADKIRRSIASHDFGTTGAWKRITVSGGAATIDAGYRPADEAGLMNRREYTGNLLREAYQALDSGRSAGTNRTTVGAYRR